MDDSMRAPGYDLFKLIVAIVLLLLSFVLMWPAAPPAPAPTMTALRTLPATVSVSPTSLPPATTASPIPSPAETNVSNSPAPTATFSPEASATPTPGTSAAAACQAATSRSRLQVGRAATIRRRLNFRSSPGIRDNWLRTNIPGTRVEIIGGPECVPYWTGAYLWWHIKLPDGHTGWSAESSLQGSFYFIEPR